MKYIKYLDNGCNFTINPKQVENVEWLVGRINDVIKKKGLLLCYCLDGINGKASKFHLWDIRPYEKGDEE